VGNRSRMLLSWGYRGMLINDYLIVLLIVRRSRDHIPGARDTRIHFAGRDASAALHSLAMSLSLPALYFFAFRSCFVRVEMVDRRT